MSSNSHRGQLGKRWAGVLLLVAVLASASIALAASLAGDAPPEVTANIAAGGWPAHNHDLSNTRANLTSSINSSNVGTLKKKWAFSIPAKTTGFGIMATTPITVGGVVYFQDMRSNVYALDETTGTLKWQRIYNKPTVGPNGVAYGYGLIFGNTDKAVFALNATTGKQVWARKLTRNAREGIDMAPAVYDNTVLTSTVPGNVRTFYVGHAVGFIHALDAMTGTPKWSFSTVIDPDTVWGNATVNNGGGLWYPPAIDSKGRVYMAVANPGPWPNTPDNPNGKSRPGKNLFTNTLLVLDGQTGKHIWHNQVLGHDVRDLDLMLSPILTQVPVDGVMTDIVISGGKMGKVYAFRSDNGKRLWTVNVGKHKNDGPGPLPHHLVEVCPGPLGGIETPMALAGNSLYVPWLNLCAKESATGLGGLDFTSGTGGFHSLNPATGATNWKRFFKQPVFGAATVANDVVFTATFDGKVYGMSVKDGSILWQVQAPAGVNAFPAVTKTMLLVGAGSPGPGNIKNPKFQLVAYSLNGQ